MSLETDGFWSNTFWDVDFWEDGFWYEVGYPQREEGAFQAILEMNPTFETTKD